MEGGGEDRGGEGLRSDGGVRVVCWTGFDGSGVWDDGPLGVGTSVVRVQILVGLLNLAGIWALV